MKIKQRILWGTIVSTTAFEGDVHGVWASIFLGAFAVLTYEPGTIKSIAVGWTEKTYRWQNNKEYETVRAPA